MECQMLRRRRNICAVYLCVENLHGRRISRHWKVSVIVTIYKARRDIQDSENTRENKVQIACYENYNMNVLYLYYDI